MLFPLEENENLSQGYNTGWGVLSSLSRLSTTIKGGRNSYFYGYSMIEIAKYQVVGILKPLLFLP